MVEEVVPPSQSGEQWGEYGHHEQFLSPPFQEAGQKNPTKLITSQKIQS